ncbi:MAG TPA: hypothetical protein VMT88_14100, partial [Actinomycetes bacterium]|nr:hypothetical protein [Actinomycetes bacterium]
MTHLSDGVLRRYVDEPGSLPDVELDHLQHCERCSRTLAEVQVAGQAMQTALLSRSNEPVDIDAAWDRLQSSLQSNARTLATVPVDRQSFRARVLKAPVLAAAGALLVVGGATAAAANDWLPIFHTESITPISVNVDDLTQLPDLSAFGQWDLKTDPTLVDVSDASAATNQTGLVVSTPTDLPTGVEGTPQFQVLEKQVATFTFSQHKAAATVSAAGESLPPLPPGLDGAVLRLELGPAVVQTWSQQSGAPTMIVAQVVAPSASSNGIALAPLRDALLSLPGLPADVAAELRAATGDGTTLPLPVPSDEFTTTSVDV